jgi:hypothetical protein
VKTAARIEAMNAPTEPFEGWLMEGDGDVRIGEGFGAAGGGGFVAVIVTSGNLMDGSSAIIAISKPAQPSWLSTASGS